MKSMSTNRCWKDPAGQIHPCPEGIRLAEQLIIASADVYYQGRESFGKAYEQAAKAYQDHTESCSGTRHVHDPVLDQGGGMSFHGTAEDNITEQLICRTCGAILEIRDGEVIEIKKES